MVELMREVGFGIPVVPQDWFYVIADASRQTDDASASEFLKQGRRGRGDGRGLRRSGHAPPNDGPLPSLF